VTLSKVKLAMPCGFVEEKESNEMAGAREMEEETGFVITEDQLNLYKSEITLGNQVFDSTPSR
jgi:ADP-ribose pyrophosphatase YjhB (NUDIX family)